MKKKIMLIVPMLHQGGFERVCVATARLLEPFFEVFIVIFDSMDIAYDIKGLNVIDLHLGVKKELIGKVMNACKRCLAVRKMKDKLNIDISYSFGSTANLVNVLSGRKGQIWVGLRSYMDMANERKIRLFCKRADKIICCSKMIEEEIKIKYRSEKAVTIYNPLDTEDIIRRAAMEEPRIPWNDREHIVVSMGREDDVKGYWHLLKSFALVQQEIDDARLMIVGDGDFEEYRKLAKDLDIADYVYFPGLKKNPFPYLYAGDLYVLTSYNEGFPNALVEAMALRLPVISTDCMTGPREILMKEYVPESRSLISNALGVVNGDYGVLIPNMNPIKNLNAGETDNEERILAQEMKRFITDASFAKKYGEAALLRSGDFSNDTYVRTIKNLLK